MSIVDIETIDHYPLLFHKLSMFLTNPDVISTLLYLREVVTNIETLQLGFAGFAHLIVPLLNKFGKNIKEDIIDLELYDYIIEYDSFVGEYDEEYNVILYVGSAYRVIMKVILVIIGIYSRRMDKKINRLIQYYKSTLLISTTNISDLAINHYGLENIFVDNIVSNTNIDFVSLFVNYYNFENKPNAEDLIQLMNKENGFLKFLYSFMRTYEAYQNYRNKKLKDFVNYLNEEYYMNLIFVPMHAEHSIVIPRLDAGIFEWKLVMK